MKLWWFEDEITTQMLQKLKLMMELQKPFFKNVATI
jgi:hypothetical protein